MKTKMTMMTMISAFAFACGGAENLQNSESAVGSYTSAEDDTVLAACPPCSADGPECALHCCSAQSGWIGGAAMCTLGYAIWNVVGDEPDTSAVLTSRVEPDPVDPTQEQIVLEWGRYDGRTNVARLASKTPEFEATIMHPSGRSVGRVQGRPDRRGQFTIPWRCADLDCSLELKIDYRGYRMSERFSPNRDR